MNSGRARKTSVSLQQDLAALINCFATNGSLIRMGSERRIVRVCHLQRDDEPSRNC